MVNLCRRRGILWSGRGVRSHRGRLVRRILQIFQPQSLLPLRHPRHALRSLWSTPSRRTRRGLKAQRQVRLAATDGLFDGRFFEDGGDSRAQGSACMGVWLVPAPSQFCSRCDRAIIYVRCQETLLLSRGSSSRQT